MEIKIDTDVRYMLDSPKVPKERIDELEYIAMKRIKGALSRHSKPCLGYSMGKDSIVVQNMLRKSGLGVDEILWATTNTQYKANVDWYNKYEADTSRWVDIPRPTFEELETVPDLLFPNSTKMVTQWMNSKWKAQQKTLVGEGYDLFITGRRTAEHNFCGRKDEGYLAKGKQYDTLSPIGEWKFDDVIAYIHYNGLDLPPSYFYKYGFFHGSGAWAQRMRMGKFTNYTINDCFDEVYEVEPELIHEAADKLSAAKRYLEMRNLI